MAYTTIDDPSEYFTTTLWTGNGTSSGRSITNSANAGDFKPDWLWIKPRTGTNATHHQIYDSSRGVSKSLRSSSTAGDLASSAYGHVSAYDTNGFTSVAGSNNNENLNENSSTFVAWQWKVNGGTTTTNDASSTGIGDIDSVIQANQTAGISIVTYTGTDTNGETFAHGLGAIPDMVIIKRRGADGDDWAVQLATTLGNTNALRLNSSSAYTGSNGAGFWNDTSPTSTVMSLGTRAEVNSASTNTYVGYFFKSIQGYSKIGTYTGNGNADGAFVYTGFKPALVIVKKSSAGENWNMTDSKRSPFNVCQAGLSPSTSNAEDTTNGVRIDLLSNGFKARDTAGQYNDNGANYIYMAFAEHPFVSSKGVPTTAR